MIMHSQNLYRDLDNVLRNYDFRMPYTDKSSVLPFVTLPLLSSNRLVPDIA
jgi:hypothetical protein